MKALWAQFAVLIDQRSTRERAMIMATACIVIGALMQLALIDPLASERKRLLRATEGDQAEIAKLAAQTQALVRAKGTDPDAAARARLGVLAARLAELQTEIDAQSAELVAPEKIAALLEKMLVADARIRVVGVRTLPPASVDLTLPVQPPSSGPAAQPQAAAPAGAQPALSERSVVEDPRPVAIYRHSVEITMRGTYLDLLAYLKRIEALPVRLFWDRVSFAATGYPNVTMRLVVYTISLDKTWMKV